jgi:3-isopropylmalate dehydratase small subunit
MIRGRVWKFGDNISTDHIAPGRYFHLRNNLEELAKHVLEDAMEDFAKKVQKVTSSWPARTSDLVLPESTLRVS